MEETITPTPGENKNLPHETASELAHRHLADQNHEITDEEIRNIDLELDTTLTHTHLNADEVEQHIKVRDQEEGDDNEKSDIVPTPADVLGS